MKIEFGILLIFSVVIVVLPVYAETSSIFSQSVYDNTFTKNATNPSDPARKISTYYMLAGETEDKTYVSTIHMNTHNIPKSDIWNDVKIDSSTIELLVMLSEGEIEKYLLTIHICTDDYEEKLKERWLSEESNSLPYSTVGDHKTEDCIRTSSQDSAIISKSNLPQIIKLDVTNLTRELIELGSRGIIYVVTATPLDEQFEESSKIPSRKFGTLAITSGGLEVFYGNNVLPMLEITYSSNPTSTINILQNALVVVPPLIAIVLSIILYWHSQKRSHSALVTRNAESLGIEINGNNDALQGIRGYQIIEYDFTDERGSQHVRYTNGFLDEDAYNGILTSGEFTYFRTNTQTILRELYTRIRDHNEQIKYTNELEDQINIQQNNNPNVTDIVGRYDVNITTLENEILQLIPQITIELNTEIEKQTSRLSLRHLHTLLFGFFSQEQS